MVVVFLGQTPVHEPSFRPVVDARIVLALLGDESDGDRGWYSGSFLRVGILFA